ncbi:[weak similarity to] DEAH ATP-dependent helicase, partial [methanotrophic bacterial endosymbiont of Bathymodiolus sp.]
SGEVTAGFEYDDRTVFNEDSGQPTSIDLAISGETARIFIEAKLVEREFGGCSVFSGGECDGRNPVSYGVDGCYLHHIGRKYWERMNEFGLGETALGSGPICPFISYYQFFQRGAVCSQKEWLFRAPA